MRELFHELSRAAEETQDHVIQVRHLSQTALSSSTRTPASNPEDEKQRIAAALNRAGGNASEAARHLGIHRSTLYRRMKRLGMDIP